MLKSITTSALIAAALFASVSAAHAQATQPAGYSVDMEFTASAGDYNGDGTVDAADYAVWRHSVGATGRNLPADGNRDGTVDINDYGIWFDNLGAR